MLSRLLFVSLPTEILTLGGVCEPSPGRRQPRVALRTTHDPLAHISTHMTVAKIRPARIPIADIRLTHDLFKRVELAHIVVAHIQLAHIVIRDVKLASEEN